jgi:hypothetical protein
MKSGRALNANAGTQVVNLAPNAIHGRQPAGQSFAGRLAQPPSETAAASAFLTRRWVWLSRPQLGDRFGDAYCLVGPRRMREDCGEETPALLLPRLEVQCCLHRVTFAPKVAHPAKGCGEGVPNLSRPGQHRLQGKQLDESTGWFVLQQQLGYVAASRVQQATVYLGGSIDYGLDYVVIHTGWFWGSERRQADIKVDLGSGKNET